MYIKLHELEEYWSNCIKEVNLFEVFQCQKLARRRFASAYSTFMPYHKKAKSKRKITDIFDLKRLEISLLPLRRYLESSIFVLIGLKKTDESDQGNCSFWYRRYLDETITDLQRYQDYADWSLKNIKRMHTNHNLSATSISCESTSNETYFWNAYRQPSYNYNCSFAFDPVLVSSFYQVYFTT